MQPERHQLYAALADVVGRHGDPPDLTAFERGVYSQNGEDGVIAEILHRVGPGARSFVEFGAQRGTEGNCVLLADALGWTGLFIEADPDLAGGLAFKYRGNERVDTLQATVTRENIDRLLDGREPDVLSIDVDGNDLWIWRAMTARPRLVVVEYNAGLPLDRAIVQPYDPAWTWQGTTYYGASLAALERLGSQKGYRLVHTELTGVNAFFVRDDLAGPFDSIVAPRRSVNHFNVGGGHPPHPGPEPYVEFDE